MRLRKGHIYAIYFYDHSLAGEPLEPLQCVIFGTPVKQTKRQIVMSTWEVINHTKETREYNREVTSIIRSTIFKIQYLAPIDK